MPEEAINEIKVDRKHRKIGNIAPELADRCYTCGTCAGGCPATGLVPGWDPRKAIRAIVFGLEQEVIDSKWPWVCTLCGRC
jgi:dimethylglycine catabolism B